MSYGVIGTQVIDMNTGEIISQEIGGTLENAGGSTAASGSDIEPRTEAAAAAGEGEVLDDGVVEPDADDGSTGAGDSTYETELYGTLLYTMNLDGTGLTRLENYQTTPLPEGRQGYIELQSFASDAEGNLWVLEYGSFYYYDTPEGWVESEEDPMWNYYVDDGYGCYLRQLDATGAELASVDLSSMANGTDYFYVNGMAMDAAGNIYIGSDTSIYVFDSAGNSLCTLEPGQDSYVQSLVALSDGTVAAMYHDNTAGSMVLSPIDVTAKTFGTKMELPYNVYSIYPGGGDYLYYYTNAGNFYGYNAATSAGEKLFSWLSCDINENNLNSVTVLSDGRVLCSTYNWSSSSGSNYELALLTSVPASSVPQKTVLTMATQYLDYNLRAEIIEFNKSNSQYRIEVIDYSEYNTEEDYTAGLTRLNTEIISGNVPDILDLNGLPIQQYSAKGLLEDLYTFLDSDSELSRESLMPTVMAALEIDGKLYQAVSSFAVQTVVGATSVVGEEMGWTMDEFLAIYDQMPDGMQIFDESTTKETIMNYCLALDMDSFVDWTTGECNFNSEAFIKVLEFVNMFPDEYDWESVDWEDYEETPDRIMNGKQMLIMDSVYDFQYFQMLKAMFGGEITYKGFPTEYGVGNMLSVSSGIAITTSCADKEGAWQFVRRLFTQEYQEENGWNFPTNVAAFDKMLEEAMTPEYQIDYETGEYVLDENGEKIEVSKGGWGWGDLMIEIYAITQEEADQIMALIESADRTSTTDESIQNIVMEEAAAYFAGQKTAQDVAGLIQSRVNIYVNEQR